MARDLAVSGPQILDFYTAAVHESASRLGLELDPRRPRPRRSWSDIQADAVDIPIDIDIAVDVDVTPDQPQPVPSRRRAAPPITAPPMRRFGLGRTLWLAMLAACAGFLVTAPLLVAAELANIPVHAKLERGWRALRR